MYASIRRYKTDSNEDLTRQVIDHFLPVISSAPGFVAYYGVREGDGVWASVSIFETKAQAEESDKFAAAFVKDNISWLGKPEITAGEVVAHKEAPAHVTG